ncbi:uncharacterized protein [Rutidosis leptorrhynchoides]|uniref:uncharacterized protein n=1 Tax=Rutidosis leptorrhynchoides TaxID=125765 RepID=UPI003A995788
MFYGATIWDPCLIVTQIVCLQCLYYLTLGVLLSILVGSHLSRMSLVYFFDYAALTTSTVTGWCVIVSFLLSSLAGSVYMLYLIERSKKCLDFSATLYIIHLFICIIYGGWPASITWWVVYGTCIAAMTCLGERLCMIRELRDITIPRHRTSKKCLTLDDTFPSFFVKPKQLSPLDDTSYMIVILFLLGWQGYRPLIEVWNQ